MINFVPQSTGLSANGAPDAALLQAMAARKKAQADMSGGAGLRAAASTQEPIYNKSLGYAKLLAGGIGGLMEGNEARQKVETAKQGAMSAGALAQSLGLSPEQAKQIQGMYLANPEAASALVKQMSERLFAKPADRYVDEKLPGGGLAQRNATTNELGVRVQPEKPEFGVIGTSPQTGADQRGFIDKSARTVTPLEPQGAQAGPSVIPPVPPGVDPKVWHEQQSKAQTAAALPAPADAISGLRKEIQGLPSYKNISQAAPIYKSMMEAAGRDTKAADLNMVYGLGKIMDPTSVVREGEIQMANDTQGWSDKLNGFIKSIQGEGRLTAQTRNALMQEAYGRMSSYKQMFDQDSQQYQGIVERNRMNPADVIPSFGEFERYNMQGPPVPADLQQQVEAARQAEAPQAAPQPQPAQPAPVPGEDGWTDMGGGVRIRERR